MPASNVAATQAHLINLFTKDRGPQILVHPFSVGYVQLTDGGGECVRYLQFHRLIYQQRTTDTASPASLVSLYLLFISLAVCAIAVIVASRSMRWRLAISLLAIAYAVHALTAPKAHRSIQGTWTNPATGSQVIPR